MPAIGETLTTVITGIVNAAGAGGIVVYRDNGEVVGIGVNSDTIITDKDGNKLSIVNINKGDKVIVTYITTEYLENIAKSIKKCTDMAFEKNLIQELPQGKH
jgi:hypothetical protein